MKRTDHHRKGAIIPGEYKHVLSYNMTTTMDGWPVPSLGINCEMDYRTEANDGTITNGTHRPDGMCCITGMRNIAKVKWAKHGTTGKCTVCGSSFIYGEVWEHEPTNEHIHVGHICGEKYGLLVDRSAFELEADRRKNAIAVNLKKILNKEKREAILNDNPGLAEALDMDHYILSDLKSNLKKFHNLSKKQIALAFKIQDQINNPKPEDKKVEAPTGKQTFKGVVVSVKDKDTSFGPQLKCTVKVQTEDGIWLAWGTVPRNILRQATENGCMVKGCEVEITATLSHGNDDHFVFMKRPNGNIVTFNQ